MSEHEDGPEPTKEDKPYQRTIQSLKQSDIYLLEGALVRQDNEGNEIARFEINDIRSVSAKRRLGYVGLTILVAGLVLIGVGLLGIEPSNWAWAAYIGGGLIAILGVLGIIEYALVVEVEGEGDTFEFIVQETLEDLRGFAYSAGQYVKTQQTGRARR